MKDVIMIGFVGIDRVGKTTMANALHDAIPEISAVISFADDLRQEIVELYPNISMTDMDGISKNQRIYLKDTGLHPSLRARWEEIYGIAVDDITVSIRDVMVTHGTHIRRNENANYWVDKFIAKVDALSDDTHIVIVDDMRFGTEFSIPRGCRHFKLCYLFNTDTLMFNDGSNVAENNMLKYVSTYPEIFNFYRVAIPVMDRNISNIKYDMLHFIENVLCEYTDDTLQVTV